jgi:hypothetical protein
MNFEQKVQKIWEERINQKIDSSLILFAELKSQFSLKNTQTFSDMQNLDQYDLSQICECLALESSIARAQRNTKLSQQALLKIENEVDFGISLKSFNFQFEKAISSFTKSDWIEAVHYFLKAKNLARNDLQKATCLINLILCSEYLDISHEQSKEELTILLQNLNSEIRKGIESQIQALNLREKFRQNLITPDDLSLLETSDINQSSYFLTYIYQIPYISQKNSAQQLEAFTLKQGHLFNKDFRMRTLTYQWAETDSSSGRLIDHIERIYLWTWKWMHNPQNNNMDLLVKSIKHFPWNELSHLDKLSPDSQSMFLLALGWLNYFDHSLESLHDSISKKIKFAVNNKVLSSERSVQLQLISKRADVSLENANAKSIFNIISQFKEQTSQNHNNFNNNTIAVDLSKYIIKIDGRNIHSKSLSTALALIFEKDNIEVDQFFNKTLSSIEYDHFLNAHQISNIIYKLNKILNSQLTIKQKNGLIYSVGNKNCIQLFYADLRTQQLVSHNEWTSLVQNLRKQFSLISENKTQSRSKKILAMQEKFSQFNRQDLQKELNLSKTEAVRLLQNWLSSGIVQKKGFSKKITYHFSTQSARTA